MSWYSATIFSMINDYFRREFNEYVKINLPPSRPPTPPESNTIQHTESISSNDKLEMPHITSQFNLTAAADDEKRSQAMMTSEAMVTAHSNQQNNKILNKRPLIPIIIADAERLVYADNGRCHFDEYVVQLLSGNPVCMRRT